MRRSQPGRTVHGKGNTEGGQRIDDAKVRSGDDPLGVSPEESDRITLVAANVVLSADGDSDDCSEHTTMLAVRLTDPAGIGGQLAHELNEYDDQFDQREPRGDVTDDGKLYGPGPAVAGWYDFGRCAPIIPARTDQHGSANRRAGID